VEEDQVAIRENSKKDESEESPTRCTERSLPENEKGGIRRRVPKNTENPIDERGKKKKKRRIRVTRWREIFIIRSEKKTEGWELGKQEDPSGTSMYPREQKPRLRKFGGECCASKNQARGCGGREEHTARRASEGSGDKENRKKRPPQTPEKILAESTKKRHR